jgi:hypothetical protein
MRPVLRAAAYVWTLPNSVLGAVAGLLSFRRPRVRGGIVVFEGPPRGSLWLVRMFRRSAVTFGHVVLSLIPLRGPLLAHELHHVRQYERLGILYLPVYLAIYPFTGYRRHPFEVAAWRAEAAARAASFAPGGGGDE